MQGLSLEVAEGLLLNLSNNGGLIWKTYYENKHLTTQRRKKKNLQACETPPFKQTETNIYVNEWYANILIVILVSKA